MENIKENKPHYDLSIDIDFAEGFNYQKVETAPVVVMSADNIPELILALYTKYAGMFKASADIETWCIHRVDKSDDNDLFFVIHNNRQDTAAESFNAIYNENAKEATEAQYETADAIVYAGGTIGNSLNGINRSMRDSAYAISGALMADKKIKCSKLTMGGWQ